MECTLWREMASDYIDGTLSPSLMESMRVHLSVCPACHRDEATLRSLSREMNLLPTVDPPLFFGDNVMAAIERQGNRRGLAHGPWWQTLLPQLGRLAMGTALTGGAVAAIAYTLLIPNSVSQDVTTAAGPRTAPISTMLPVPADPASARAAAPRLRIARVTSMVAGSGPAYDFSFWLENADKGTARWQFVGDNTAYRFMLTDGAAQTVHIPYPSAPGKGAALALKVYWTADARDYTRYLLLPIPREGDGIPSARQSFGLPEEGIVDAASHIAARYGVPITLDNVSPDLRVRIAARDETVEETLRRHLAGSDLRVTASKAGILIERVPQTGEAAAAAPAAETTPAAP